MLTENKLSTFLKDVTATIKKIEEYPIKKALIIHHDDADGLTSAAIILKALERKGYETKLICIEKLYPEVVERLHAERGNLYFYTDIAAAHGSYLSEINNGKNLTVILDHHDAEHASDTEIHVLDPELYGISGENDASGATTAYLFAKALSPENVDLAPLAVIGSAEIPGSIRGLNRIALHDSINQKLIEIKKTKSGETYQILKLGHPASHKVYSEKLTILGAVGYYRGGPKMGIEACLSGFTPDTTDFVDKLKNERKSVNKRVLGWLYRNGLKQTPSIQWFHSKDAFKGMGVKVIGTFCSYLSYQRWLNPRKYILGFMNMQPEIPGFGKLASEWVKVSARTPRLLQNMIKRETMPPLSYLMPKAAKFLGGIADGHSVAASGIVPKGMEISLIDRIENLIVKTG